MSNVNKRAVVTTDRHILSDTLTDVPLFRHDPVTARAISRLSHGVAKLKTCISPPGSRAVHDNRGVLSSRSADNDGSEEGFDCLEEDCAVWQKSTTSGMKRKWQSAKPGSSMELDDFGQTKQTQYRARQSFSPNHHISFGDGDPLSHYSDVDVDFFDHLDRCSAGSSMLSMTEPRSGGSDTFSHASDADEEDGDNNGNLTTANENDSWFPSSSFDQVIGDKIRNPTDEIAGEEEYSDGLTSHVKMRRFSINDAAVRSKHSARIQNIRSGKQTNHCLSSELARCKLPQRPHSSSRSNLRRESRHRSGDPHNDGTSGRIAGSLEELADDEQSDFPADESMPIDNHRLLSRSLIWSIKPDHKPKRMCGLDGPDRFSKRLLVDVDSDSEDTCAILHSPVKFPRKKASQSMYVDDSTATTSQNCVNSNPPVVFRSSNLNYISSLAKKPTP